MAEVVVIAMVHKVGDVDAADGVSTFIQAERRSRQQNQEADVRERVCDKLGHWTA